MIKQNYKSTEY